MTDSKKIVAIQHFSDVLCVWAYVSQIRMDEMKINFPERLKIDYHFVPIFSSVKPKIENSWAERGGFDAYSSHVKSVADQFEHVDINPDIWVKDIPDSSASCHECLVGMRLLEEEGIISSDPIEKFSGRTLFEECIWQFRLAFFRDLKNISNREVQFETLSSLGAPTHRLDELLTSGKALAALFEDYKFAETMPIKASPSLVMNEKRQILAGNVGYRLIKANVEELFRQSTDYATWC